jgi:peptide/nickel transport system ATP-binding protein
MAVNGVDLDVGPGEIVGLVGESGCGKTATANALMGLLDRSSVSATSIRLGDDELTTLSEGQYRKLRGRVLSMVFQEPLTALDPVFTIGSQLRSVLMRHGRARRGNAREMAEQCLRRMGLGDVRELMGRYPHQLSGGMRQRVVIAMAMACKPNLLIADEPTTALDVTTQARVLDELQELGRESGTSILLITHDLGVASRICDRIVVMHRGAFVETAAPEELFARPEHPYTRELLAAIPKLNSKPPKFSHAEGDLVIRLDHRHVSHPVRKNGKRRRLVAVRDVSLEIRRGEILGLVGESGCGKSTLAQSLVGLKPAEGGSLCFGDVPIAGNRPADWKELRRHVQLVFQDPRGSLSPRRTVEQSLAEPLEHFGIGSRAERSARVAKALERVGLDPDFSQRYPHELSGGQRQRVALARALISEPMLIVADEPLSSLDVSIQARIIELLRELRREMGFAVLMVSHDLAVIRQLADRVAVMYLGRIVETGTADDVFENPAHPYTRALLSAASNPAAERNKNAGDARARYSEPPSLLTPPPGCVFHTRCPVAMERCAQIDPSEFRIDHGSGQSHPHLVKCLLYE